MNTSSYATRLHHSLTTALQPLQLEICDDSAHHAGHGGAHQLGETHFTVRIVSGQFRGLSRVARHRLVYAAVAEELQERVHALVLVTMTPEEMSILGKSAP
jgi:BolA family transcriptional regulator, general stress-responsive regulator